MKIRAEMFFPGQVVDAQLVDAADQASRTGHTRRLEAVSGNTPIQLPPPTAFGAEIVEATLDERAALRDAGYELGQVPFHARYATGNPHAPMGIGGYSVEAFPDGAIVLVHERHGVRRAWQARTQPTFWTQLVTAMGRAGFPRKVGPMSAPPGTDSFAFSATSADGVASKVSGFPSSEYDDLEILFNKVVSQMSKDQVFGMELPTEATYVTEVRENHDLDGVATT